MGIPVPHQPQLFRHRAPGPSQGHPPGPGCWASGLPASTLPCKKPRARLDAPSVHLRPRPCRPESGPGQATLSRAEWGKRGNICTAPSRAALASQETWPEAAPNSWK